MPALDLHIDTMTATDVDAAVAIDLEAFASGELGAAAADPRALREGQLREELARSWARVRVARSDGALIGYALVWHVVDEIHLLNVAVGSAYRRRGVARALLDDLVAYAREKSARRILLEVRPSNLAAIALYEAFGFTQFSRRPRYYADGEDAVEMELSISP